MDHFSSVVDNKGYKGVVVCEHWHCFQNFCSDLPAIPGYNNWKDNPVKYEFDKDYSHRRYYSPDTEVVNKNWPPS